MTLPGRAKVVLKPMQTFVSHNENRDLGWSLMCLGRIELRTCLLLEAEPCLNVTLDVKFSRGQVREHIRFFFRNKTTPNKTDLTFQCQSFLYSFPSFTAERFLPLLYIPRLGIVKKLKQENAQDVVTKALNMSSLAGLAVDHDSA